MTFLIPQDWQDAGKINFLNGFQIRFANCNYFCPIITHLMPISNATFTVSIYICFVHLLHASFLLPLLLPLKGFEDKDLTALKFDTFLQA